MSPSWMSMIGQRMLYRTGHPSDMNRHTNKPCGLDRTPGPYRNNKRQIMTEYEKMYRNDGLYAYGADRPPVSDPAFRKKADSMTDELTERLMRSLGNDPFMTLDVLLISAAKVLHGKCIEDLYEDYAPAHVHDVSCRNMHTRLDGYYAHLVNQRLGPVPICEDPVVPGDIYRKALYGDIPIDAEEEEGSQDDL